MKNLSILFVEDEPSIRDELIPFIRRYTKNLYIAEDGEEGLLLYETYLPDIIISDIKMPKVSGIEMVKAIKKKNPNQAVIFTTAHSDSAFFIEAIEMQIDSYILKPIDLDILDEKIRKINNQIILQKEYALQKIITEEIAHLQGNMLAVLDKNGEKLFANRNLLEFWNVESLQELKGKGYFMNQCFVKQKGSFYPTVTDRDTWISELEKFPPEKRIVSIRDMQGVTKSYKVDIIYVEENAHKIIVFHEITDIIMEKERYREKSLIDELTQLPNRSQFNQRLENEIQNALQQQKKLSLILFDLDHFKQINDLYGHLIGDEVLVTLGKEMKKLIRDYDLLARWGGEEFVILLPGTDIDGAKVLAEKMRNFIQNYKFPHIEKLTCSFGISTLSKKEESTISLFRRADDALYKAKLNGRNRVEYL